MRLIFVRHPQTQANVKKLIYGITESDYSEGGQATIPEIIKALHDVEFDVLISSPLRRTRLLAQEIARDHGYDEQKIEIEDRIVEMNFGILENLTTERAKTKHKEIYEALLNDYEQYPIPGGESCVMVYNRVATFLKELYEIYEAPREGRQTKLNAWEECSGAISESLAERGGAEKTIVVTAHSMVIHAALAYLLQIDLKEIWHLKVEPGTIVDLDYRCGFAMLQGLSGPFNVRMTDR